ncbi:right-handed parallel beta-helix repeat-containing protein, partial [bacterium]|nr:right-handed parallel beta-helix repeat-containing protein [bacterium]
MRFRLSAFLPCAIVALGLMGTASADTVHVPSEHSTIQAGIDAAGHGGTVIVAPGTYRGPGNLNIDMDGLCVTLTSSGSAAETIIDCELDGRAFDISSPNDTTAVIDGFTIRNGTAQLGGGIDISAAAPTINDCVFESCTADNGGAIHMSSTASPTITDCTFSGNVAKDGGGLYSGSFEGSIEGCTFSGNVAENGGGLYLSGTAEHPVTGCAFVGNTADSGGGVFYVLADCAFEGCSFFGNTANFGAGAYFQSGYNDPGVTRCSFVGNDGGGVYSLMAELTFTQCIFAFDESEAGFTCSHANPNPTITHCVVFGNAGGDSLCGIHTDNLFEDPRLCGLAT